MKSIENVLKGVRREIAKVIVGQDAVIERLLVAVMGGGHAILEGVPGLAKTLLIHALARTLDLTFNRIQFTPDLVPSDVTGTDIISSNASGQAKDFRFIPGPVFSNIVLADEINRTPPKTQSALLQAMQEKRVTVLGETHRLPDPFFVFATQNPIEYEGTYPLPEAQLDRFFIQVLIGYPDEQEELRIIDSDADSIEKVKPVLEKREILSIQKAVRETPVSERVKRYAVQLARATRPASSRIAIVREHVRWGVGPRATQMLVRAAQARSVLRGAKFADKTDVDAMLVSVFRHRLILDPGTASGEGATAEQVLNEVKKTIEAKL